MRLPNLILAIAGFVFFPLFSLGAQAASGDQNSGNPPADQTSGCQGFICWGVLAVPFKAELSGNEDVFGSMTVGPYVGHDFGFGQDSNSINIMPILFAGYSRNMGSGTGADASFVTYGGGVLFPLGFLPKSLEFGVVVGFDHTAKSNKFEYNDKPWASALIAFPLN